MTKEEMLALLLSAYTGTSGTEEGSFAGDVLRACADAMAELWSMEIDGLERRAFVSTAAGDWLTRVCADRGVDRRDGEDDEDRVAPRRRPKRRGRKVPKYRRTEEDKTQLEDFIIPVDQCLLNDIDE